VGRRRLAYQIDRYREASYHIIHFDAPADSIADLERTLLITEDVIRHLICPRRATLKAARGKGDDIADLVPGPTSRRTRSRRASRSTNPRAKAAPAASTDQVQEAFRCP